MSTNVAQDQLWAPWRLPYIVSTKEPAADGCFLCRYVAEPDRDIDNLVISRNEWTVTVLNRFPYNNGHLLVAPLKHKAELAELDDAELLDCMQALQRMTRVVARAMNAHGFNIGLNLGQVAGAGLPGHLHWHLVPRWRGDTNFMPVLADLSVIPQSLASACELLRESLIADLIN